MEHLVIPDGQRHEAKGASTAAAGTVLRANGNGTTTFGSVAYSELTGRPGFSGYQRVLAAGSTASNQSPANVNVPLQIEFGGGVATPNATLNSAGVLTFNAAGDYQITTNFNFARTAGAGQAILLSRVVVNGTAATNMSTISMDNATTIIPVSNTYNITATPGTTLQWQFYRDSAGINNGGLALVTPSLSGWTAFPSATIVVDKYVGAV